MELYCTVFQKLAKHNTSEKIIALYMVCGGTIKTVFKNTKKKNWLELCHLCIFFFLLAHIMYDHFYSISSHVRDTF